MSIAIEMTLINGLFYKELEVLIVKLMHHVRLMHAYRTYSQVGGSVGRN